jgi:hypothetical protein
LVFPLQVNPAALQLRPEQHRCPAPPQARQLSLPPAPPAVAQTVLTAVQTLDEQQGSPAWPQATHALALHTVLPAVQRLFVQQASPSAPHLVPPPSRAAPPSMTVDTQALAEQVRFAALPVFAHAAPARTQVAPPVVLVQQQPPALHRLAEQQAAPAPPQV